MKKNVILSCLFAVSAQANSDCGFQAEVHFPLQVLQNAIVEGLNSKSTSNICSGARKGSGLYLSVISDAGNYAGVKWELFPDQNVVEGLIYTEFKGERVACTIREDDSKVYYPDFNPTICGNIFEAIRTKTPDRNYLIHSMLDALHALTSQYDAVTAQVRDNAKAKAALTAYFEKTKRETSLMLQDL